MIDALGRHPAERPHARHSARQARSLAGKLRGIVRPSLGVETVRSMVILKRTITQTKGLTAAVQTKPLLTTSFTHVEHHRRLLCVNFIQRPT